MNTIYETRCRLAESPKIDAGIDGVFPQDPESTPRLKLSPERVTELESS
jgi:hypothetical protein